MVILCRNARSCLIRRSCLRMLRFSIIFCCWTILCNSATCCLSTCELFYISLDERSARLAGVPVGVVNFIFTIMIAVTVSVAARTVGALMVSSMMVVPVACAMQLGKNFKQTVWYAVGLNVLFMIIGLFAAFYLGLKPGGTIVLVGVAALLIIFIGKRIMFGKQE